LSALLFHGPGAEQAAREEATQSGMLAAPPFGTGKGLRVAAAREVVGLLQSPVIGSRRGVVLIRLDDADPKTQDVLLKTLEDYDTSAWQIILWVGDIGSVRDTVRSRCFARWVNMQSDETPRLHGAAQNLLSYVEKNQIAELISSVREHRDYLPELLDACLRLLPEDMDRHARFWPHFRPLCEHKQFTTLEFVSALVASA